MKSSSAASIFIISLFLFLSFSTLLSAQSPKCHPQDQIAIDKIKAAFGVNTTGDCCSWFPVVCDSVSPYRVIQFEVYNSDVISGQIPAAIGDLSFLKVLTFNNVSKLTGNIPSSIAKLSKLDSLSITKTGVSGPIPRFPQPLENLIAFLLPFNALTGSIPPEISSFPILEQFDLQSNKLTGTIPESFGNFPKSMFYFSLSNNLLTGAIPKSFANVDLTILDLSRNRFTGDASFLFGRNKQAQTLYLYKNNFTFDLSNVEYPSQLKAFDISHNNIFGSLSQQLTQFNFTRFYVSFNKLCGKIPQGGSLQNFGIHSYYHNQCLCGAPLPGCK